MITTVSPLVTMLLLGSACGEPVHAQEINNYCPVMTEEEVDPQVTTVYRGKTIAFCCDRCLEKFEANPQRYVAQLPQFASTLAAEPTDDSGTEHDGEAHDHGPATQATTEGPKPWLGRVRPVLVHFPLAGIPLAFLGFLAWAILRREAFSKADIPPLLVGTAAAVLAVITGNIAHDSMQFSESMHEIVERHEWVSERIMVLALALSALRIWRWNRMSGKWCCLYGIGLLTATVMLGITGYLGGSLVFGPDHLAW